MKITQRLLRDASHPTGVTERIARAAEGGTISNDEAVAAWVTVFTAGHETSVTLITNTLHAIVHQQGIFDDIHGNEALIIPAVEETLRLHTPVVVALRVARHETTLADQHIRRGDRLTVLLGAANRDPSVFDGPHEFALHRTNARSHLAFGLGAHHCLGSQLARMEARAVVRAVSRQAEHLALAQPTSWVPGRSFRSLRSLILTVA